MGVYTRSGMADLRSYFLPSGSSSNSRNVEEEEEETESMPPSKKPKRSFNSEWLCEFSWLSYIDGRMFCTVCKHGGRSNFYSTAGCSNFRVSDLRKHSKRNEHRFALEAVRLQESSNTVSDCVNRMSTRTEVAITCAMRNVYWLASEDIASLKYNSLNDLVTLQGCSALKDLYVGENAKYTHHQIVEEMQQCIADCIKEKNYCRCPGSPAIRIMVDESTDISVTKSLMVYIRYLDSLHKKCKTSFLTVLELTSGTADVIAEAIKAELAKCSIPLNKCSGFSSDGAKVMVGKQNGVAALLKRENSCIIDVLLIG